MPANQTKARHGTALLLLTRALQQQQFGGFYLSDMAAVHLELQSSEDQWSAGELALHRLLRVPTPRNNPTAHGLAPHHAARVHENHLLAVGALDGSGQPWTSIWGGEPGFAGPVAPGVLGVRSLVDKRHDPVARALLGHLAEGEILDGASSTSSAGVAGLPFSALSIDFRSRDRVKLAGRVVAGVMNKPDGGADAAAAAAAAEKEEESGVGQVQLALAVLEALGNCPKYINLKAVRPHVPRPELASDSLPLSPRALEILERADLFFLSSSNGKGQMDTNHRGGAPGLIRVVRNKPAGGDDGDGGGGSGGSSEVVLAYPEFSGNRLYQSLGNLHLDPRVGLAVPDFASSDVLYLAGTTRLLVGAESAALLPHTRLAVRVDVTAARLVRDGLPFRGDVVDFSPYNPPARRLADEVAIVPGSGAGGVGMTATLKSREILSPTVSRLTFSLRSDQHGVAPPLPRWGPGQHVTLDFSAELDVGYSHMREEDPQSLNDDYVRTFTVSSPAPAADGLASEFQITVRRHGPATGLLARWNTRVPLELPVLGFGGGGGGAGLEIPVGDAGAAAVTAVFVATGVGITPLLAQAGRILQPQQQQQQQGDGVVAGKLEVLWSLRAEDVPFALDSFRRIPGLAGVTRLFITGKAQDDESQTDELKGLGAAVVQGRISKDALLAAGLGEGASRKYYVCTGPEAARTIAGWLEKEDVVTESFQY
ncbi:hypothetical protein RB601_009690 [Gaeumannomyces tritici]